MNRYWNCLLLLVATGIGAQTLARRNSFGAAVAPDSGGVTITAVVPDSPASSAGLEVGDVIVGLGTHAIANPEDILREVRSGAVSIPLAVSILRAHRPEHLTVHLVPLATESDPKVETIYSAAEVGGSLRRTLITIPKGVLLIGGIGCYSIDNPVDLTDPYRALSHDLSRAGIIVMRIEKSRIGDSQVRPCFETDFESEYQMYAAGLSALYATAHVNRAVSTFLGGRGLRVATSPHRPEVRLRS